MQIIISHVNTDFDALASMLAAKKIYPNAQMVLTDKQNLPVRQFLNIYRDTLDIMQDNLVDWSNVTELILVDEASLSRISDHIDKLPKENVNFIVYDHHPPKQEDVKSDVSVIEPVGAAVTLLIEELRERDMSITSFEATLFGLGIYTDTGSFTYSNTTARDFQAASYLMEQGMNLEIVQQFADEIFLPEQQELLHHLFQQSKTYNMDGLQIVVSTYLHHKFQQGLATLTEKLLDITDADAALIVVEMKNRVYIVGRASSDRITLLPLLKRWQGGGHEQAGSATVKNTEREAVWKDVTENLDLMLKPAITARNMMTSPVKTIPPETSIKESGQLMFRYGHSGFPVVKNDKLLGIITRRDLEKANHHGLGHAPVKAYMTTNVISISPETTEEEIQKLIIEQDIGRLPVVENGKLIGIVSRTNIIESLHSQKQNESQPNVGVLHDNLQVAMKEQLPREIYSLLRDISQTADEAHLSTYLIGGIVRDIMLGLPNDDIDIVVEGDGIAFSNQLQANHGGEVIIHENFGTATWKHPTGLEIDVTSSRLEYYDRPAALPNVEASTLKEDLYRRDFTINAMGIYLNQDSFGQLVDPFQGQLDLKEKKIKILHNLSFIEDPTRIFRGVRFETRFQFAMDDQTEQLALQSIESVQDLSVNRIVDEMKRLFTEGHPEKTMKRLFELQFWQQYGIKEAKAKSSCHHAHKLQALYGENDLLRKKIRWFMYFTIPFYDMENIDGAKRFALTKQDAMFLREMIKLEEIKEWQYNETTGDLHRLLYNYSDEAILFVVSKMSDANEQVVLEYIKKRQHLPTLLTGEDLIKQGLKPGPLFSNVLLDLDVAVLNGKINTKDEAETWLERRMEKLDEKE